MTASSFQPIVCIMSDEMTFVILDSIPDGTHVKSSNCKIWGKWRSEISYCSSKLGSNYYQVLIFILGESTMVRIDPLHAPQVTSRAQLKAESKSFAQSLKRLWPATDGCWVRTTSTLISSRISILHTNMTASVTWWTSTPQMRRRNEATVETKPAISNYINIALGLSNSA